MEPEPEEEYTLPLRTATTRANGRSTNPISSSSGGISSRLPQHYTYERRQIGRFTLNVKAPSGTIPCPEWLMQFETPAQRWARVRPKWVSVIRSSARVRQLHHLQQALQEFSRDRTTKDVEVQTDETAFAPRPSAPPLTPTKEIAEYQNYNESKFHRVANGSITVAKTFGKIIRFVFDRRHIIARIVRAIRLANRPSTSQVVATTLLAKSVYDGGIYETLVNYLVARYDNAGE